MLLGELVKTAAMEIDYLRKRAELALLQQQFPERVCRRRERKSAVIVALGILAVAFLMKHH